MTTVIDGPAGKVAVGGGLLYFSSDSVDVTVRGVGAHGASPHKGKVDVLCRFAYFAPRCRDRLR